MTIHGEDSAGDDVGIDRKVGFLACASAYPEGVGGVRAIETHMSWVFLADGFAYKLKKPIRLPYLDFSTVEARWRDGEEELRLNGPLAPGVYLGMVPLTLEAEGGLAIRGNGRAVDWLVKMRRLPDADMLDRLIGARAVPSARLAALVVRLARFYAEAAVVDWTPAEYVRRLRDEVAADAAELAAARYGLPAARVHAVLVAQQAFLARASALFEQRIRDGRVGEGHGDLRPEHVCLAREPVIIDCLEFNREFRLLDAVEDLAFLALECERLGDAELGRQILSLYARISGDKPDPGLVSFYTSRRACLRAKTAAWHLDDPNLANPDKWRGRAGEYLELAAKYAAVLGSDA